MNKFVTITSAVALLTAIAFNPLGGAALAQAGGLIFACVESDLKRCIVRSRRRTGW